MEDDCSIPHRDPSWRPRTNIVAITDWFSVQVFRTYARIDVCCDKRSPSFWDCHHSYFHLILVCVLTSQQILDRATAIEPNKDWSLPLIYLYLPDWAGTGPELRYKTSLNYDCYIGQVALHNRSWQGLQFGISPCPAVKTGLLNRVDRWGIIHFFRLKV